VTTGTTLPRPARDGPPQPAPVVSGFSSSGPGKLEGADAALAQAIARWFDRALLDPVVGLILPGAGDLLSSTAGLVVVGMAIRRRLPASVIARMLLNLAIDAGVGAVPVLGDVFDFVHRAHVKNAQLFLERRERARSSWRDWLALTAATVIFVAALVLPVYALVRIIAALW